MSKIVFFVDEYSLKCVTPRILYGLFTFGLNMIFYAYFLHIYIAESILGSEGVQAMCSPCDLAAHVLPGQVWRLQILPWLCYSPVIYLWKCMYNLNIYC